MNIHEFIQREKRKENGNANSRRHLSFLRGRLPLQHDVADRTPRSLTREPHKEKISRKREMTTQNILREVSSAFKEWGRALHDWRGGNSCGRTGKPNMPNYKNKDARKTISIPAADMQFVEMDGKIFAQFPIIKKEELIDVTSMFPDDDELKFVEVKIQPVSGGYDLQFGFKKSREKKKSDGKFLAGGDLGLDNLLTIVSNDGVTAPLIIDGKELKSINRY